MKFDESADFGSVEHYFHFIWGYLLPALNEIIKIDSDAHKKRIAEYHFRSCGPIMDTLIDELLSFYTIDYKIMSLIMLDNDNNNREILVPRWDKWLIDSRVTEDVKWTWKNIALSNITLWFKKNRYRTDFFSSIQHLKKNVMQKTDNASLRDNSNLSSKSYLILKRSSQPKYYEKGGQAEIATYGTARRELIGLEEAAESLRKRDIPIKIFEPGQYTLQEQIIAFSHCKGVIGIEGAEFANLIWMKPKSKVIMIRPKLMVDPPALEALAKILKLDFFGLSADEGWRPKLDPDLIYKILV